MLKLAMPEEWSIPISALQHFVFCRRQFALIHTERLWQENALTSLGKLEHARVESARSSMRGRLREERSVHLVSLQWGIHGVSDVVEYENTRDGLRVTPIEYKRGVPKEHRADEVQLCAQALCLEEMHSCTIPHGFLFYCNPRRRLKVDFTAELKEQTKQIISSARELLQSAELPPATRRSECKACSLYDVCLPAARTATVAQYNDSVFNAAINDETAP